MSAKKKPASPAARRPNKVLDRLRDKLELDESDWQRFLTLAVAGFAEFELEYDRYGAYENERLSLKNVPKEWFSDAEPFRFAARRIFRRGRANLHGAVARYFLGLLDELETDKPYPGGIGLAWLKLTEAGLGECVHPAAMAELAVWHNQEFLDYLKPDEFADVIRLWLTALEKPTAWDVAATLVAANRATRHNLHTFRLFDSLMAADWLAIDVFADRLGSERVKTLVSRAVRQGNSQVRLSAYRVGLAQFGAEYARRALEDVSRPVRRWAEKSLSASNTSQFRSRVARKASRQPPNNG